MSKQTLLTEAVKKLGLEPLLVELLRHSILISSHSSKDKVESRREVYLLLLDGRSVYAVSKEINKGSTSISKMRVKTEREISKVLSLGHEAHKKSVVAAKYLLEVLNVE